MSDVFESIAIVDSMQNKFLSGFKAIMLEFIRNIPGDKKALLDEQADAIFNEIESRINTNNNDNKNMEFYDVNECMEYAIHYFMLAIMVKLTDE